jgi:hypothetical protein
MKRRWIFVWIALLAISIVQTQIVLNSDLAWHLTLNEKVLAGYRLYVDVFETNPPLSVFMYMPPVWIGQALRIAPEQVVIACVILEIAVALWVIEGLATAACLSEGEGNALVWIFVTLLAILPGAVFGQREHIAVIALTPFVTITALRLRTASSRRWMILSGIGGGLAMCIKPHFGLVVGLPMLLNAIRNRSLKVLFVLEAWIAAAIALGYAAIVALVYPDYLHFYAPMVVDAYLPIRTDTAHLIMVSALMLGQALCLVSLMARRDAAIWGEAAPWLAAALGGAATFVIQGKGWPYTAFALCVFGWAAPLLCATQIKLRPPLAIMGLLVLTFTGLYLSSPAPGFPKLDSEIEALKIHPRMLTITDHIGLGHPLVRRIGGTWVGSSPSQILAGGAIVQKLNPGLAPNKREEMDRIISFDRSHLLDDLKRNQPDLILVDSYLFSTIPFDWMAWAEADSGIQQILAGYKEVKRLGRVRILVRRTQKTDREGQPEIQ